MRRFTSYGPADSEENFCVERRELVQQCVEQLVGTNPAKGGHFFTIWGPRQTGKTWIMRQAIAEIRAKYGDKFAVGALSMQGLLKASDGEDVFLKCVPGMFREGFGFEPPAPTDWDEWLKLFARKGGLFDKPLILLIDEFDALPPPVIDRLVNTFRKMYLAREGYTLHSLGLLGVRAVLGLDSPRGSPFNVQRSMQIPNLTRDEVIDMFHQYQTESGQVVEPEVVNAVFDSTRGQPGLVGWFGELLAEKYNPGKDKPITRDTWAEVYDAAVYVEWNNTLLNLSKKAREPYRAEVMRLFTDPNVRFAMEEEWCNYLYMNGIIDQAPAPDKLSHGGRVCRFSSPFVQLRLYSGLTYNMFGNKGPLPAIDLDDWLADVFTPNGLNVTALLKRYRGYLKRLKAKGIDPWIGQPRRADLHFTEAVGHFHLYAWLLDAVGRRCSISPEFPTGNGKVDLVLRTKDTTALIEVKSFRDMSDLANYRKQAAGYANKLGLTQATLAIFAPTEDDAILAMLSGEADEDGVHVTTVAFGWV
jgi:hypothetical protein